LKSSHAILAAWFDSARWFRYADLLAVLLAVMLPWSTTAVGVLGVLFLLALIPLIPTLDTRAFLRLLSSPICLAPVAIFALALVGTLWADSPWPERLQGVNPVARLLIIPFLLYHFQRSERGAWVLIGFLGSCALLMGLSWIVLFAPELKLTATANAGVPVKNYIDQSQEFSLCMVALLPFMMSFYRQRRYLAAAGCAALALGFFANMAFVASARTVLLYLPVLLALFALIHLERRVSLLLLAGVAVVATAVWFSSPYLQARMSAIATEYHEYELNIPASTGRRLEYWQKSLRFFAASPIFGNGTGATKTLFERDALGKAGLAGEVTRNPHNQTLNVAIQWGVLGMVALYAMWLSHLLLFLRGQGMASWIGLLVVAQNMVSSLLNSHLFDFHEGYMYVLGVGIAGGMSLRAQTSKNDQAGLRGCS
jgi:O-antigen ligase